LDGNGGHGRHDRRDLPRDLLRAALLSPDHGPPAEREPHQGGTAGGNRPPSPGAASPQGVDPRTSTHARASAAPYRRRRLMNKRSLAILAVAVLGGCAVTQPLPP